MKGIAKTIVDFGEFLGGFFVGGWDVHFCQKQVLTHAFEVKVLFRLFALMAFFSWQSDWPLRARVTSMMAWCVMMQKMDSLRICCRTMKRALNRWLFLDVFEKMTVVFKNWVKLRSKRIGGSFWFVKRKVQRNGSPLLCGSFKYVLFSTLFGEMIQLDSYFPGELKPPTS